MNIRALHEAVTDQLLAAVREGDLKAIEAAIKFLKDNGVNADLQDQVAEAVKRGPALTQALPLFEDEDAATGT